MKDQINEIIQKLRSDGFVSRNWALDNYIGRLASRMNDLKNMGWRFRTERVKENGGVNYYYYLEGSPEKKVSYYVPELGKEIVKYI